MHAYGWLMASGAIAALICWLASWTGPQEPSGVWDVLRILSTSGPLALGWMASAFGYGWLLRRWLAPESEHRWATQIGLGVAAMLFLDAGLGAVGLLQLGGSMGAWIVLLFGLVMLLVNWIVDHKHTSLRKTGVSPTAMPAWVTGVISSPALAVLVVASCSAPGWLWATEFGGYDALSYHLQLPKEWMHSGRIHPLEHNIYSFLPSYFEAAYYHLMVLVGDGVRAAYACQLLHAFFTICAAAVMWRFCSAYVASLAGPIAFIIMVGTPWTVVVGSLAYDEMAVVLMTACGLLQLQNRKVDWRLGASIGVVAAGACGAKLTAVGFVAAPLFVLLVVRAILNIRHVARPALVIGSALVFAGLFLAPYLIRNASHSGNPVFPFATGIFGSAHWNQNQVTIWNAGHESQLGAVDRMHTFWDEILRYGVGAPPTAGEPWKPQWSILPWVGGLGLVASLAIARLRQVATLLLSVLLIQICFWTILTHLKSRFLLPAVAPLSAGASILALAGAALLALKDSAATRTLSGIALIITLAAWGLQPVFIFHSEGMSSSEASTAAARLGWADLFEGRGFEPSQRHLAARGSPAIYINYMLPHNAKVLLVGEAAPFYYHLDKISYNTTWDRGALSAAIAIHPGDPQAWSQHLRHKGFTHVLLHESMLDVWRRSGWIDPQLTRENIVRFVNEALQIETQFPNKATIYSVPD